MLQSTIPNDLSELPPNTNTLPFQQWVKIHLKNI